MPGWHQSGSGFQAWVKPGPFFILLDKRFLPPASGDAEAAEKV